MNDERLFTVLLNVIVHLVNNYIDCFKMTSNFAEMAQ